MYADLQFIKETNDNNGFAKITATGLSMAFLNLYILTYNCAREPIDNQAVASQLFDGLCGSSPPDLVVVSLQEIAPISASFIGGSFLVPRFARFQDAVNDAAEKISGGPYTTIAARHVGMTALMVFARDPDTILGIETAGVSFGLWDMGNKGAVGIRILYGDVDSAGSKATELTFVSAHLAAMESELARRNEDWKCLVRGLVFSSTSQERTGNATTLSASADTDEQPLLSISPRAASIYRPTSHLFVAGDLNYRTSIFNPSPEDLETNFPQPGQNLNSPKHYLNLLNNDQLNQERLAGRTCHGLIEEPVTFPPTYKYTNDGPFLVPDRDISEWKWAKHRWPSWCDRILYLDVPPWLKRQEPDAKITVQKYTALPLFPTSDHRAVTLSLTVPLVSIPSPSDEDAESLDPRITPPYDIDPDWKPKRERARALELIVGYVSYFTTTRDGGAIALATIGGFVGGFFLLKALFDL
ncbi:MAG: hypothetical protein M1818_002521 [Claussenomyces sp. TS43310]|nr:MAG: hypothetical protein M1818_002521 [Claussenomyces sp. TS43310]